VCAWVCVCVCLWVILSNLDIDTQHGKNTRDRDKKRRRERKSESWKFSATYDIYTQTPWIYSKRSCMQIIYSFWHHFLMLFCPFGWECTGAHDSAFAISLFFQPPSRPSVARCMHVLFLCLRNGFTATHILYLYMCWVSKIASHTFTYHSILCVVLGNYIAHTRTLFSWAFLFQKLHQTYTLSLSLATQTNSHVLHARLTLHTGVTVFPDWTCCDINIFHVLKHIFYTYFPYQKTLVWITHISYIFFEHTTSWSTHIEAHSPHFHLKHSANYITHRQSRTPQSCCSTHISMFHIMLMYITYFLWNIPFHSYILCITTCIFNLVRQNPAARQKIQCYASCSNICYTFTDTSCACLHCTHTHIHTRTNHK